MTLAAPFPLSPLLAGMAEAMGEIRLMLLRYEAAMVEAPGATASRQAVQDFDLAVQLLQDLEHIARLLGQELPPDMMAHNALPLAGLRLERSRTRFLSAALPAAAERQPPPRIDLFAPLVPADDDGAPPAGPAPQPDTP
ncbi:hypothetical protein [Pararhodobacter sp.]|uniref:hypothetical protein n=1 Tax=Pararhodobacter sp. TaxID=2127056 RepID=UPI002FDF2DD1|nr:hypothetical protein [Pseudomonadota bacterium]